ncbi:MAG: hypothetical protein IKX08_00585 [Lachnospiraceae bacterium]|nr:hypothetical protein [Lachnospiraceae bacterium]
MAIAYYLLKNYGAAYEKELWERLMKLTDLVYKELEGYSIPVTKELLREYFKGLK